MKIAIVFHFGNHKLWPAFSGVISDIINRYSADLYVMYQQESETLNKIKELYPTAVYILSLRGVDTGSFLLFAKHVYDQKLDYDYILKLHTKTVDRWRTELINGICGNNAEACLNVFNSDPKVGIIGTKRHIRGPDRINNPILPNLINKYKLNDNYRFVAGTIFWMRWQVFLDFISKDVDLAAEYELCELGYRKNVIPTYTHSWERLFGIICESMGYSIHGV